MSLRTASFLAGFARFTKDIPELLDRAHKLGLEGLIGKRAGSRYEAGKRTGAWIKLKLHQEQEFVIGGYTEPEGSRRYFGALLVGEYFKPGATRPFSQFASPVSG